MRTTINQRVGRRGGAYSVEELENTLNQTRKLLSDVIALADLEKEQLLENQGGEKDKDRLKKLTELVGLTQKAMQTVLHIEEKYGVSAFEARQQLDLEAARAEILERISRLAGKVAKGQARRAA